MTTPVLHFVVFQLFLLWKPVIVEGSNSSVLVRNVSSPTASNGIGNQLVPTNSTTTITVVNSTNVSITRGLTGKKGNVTRGGIINRDAREISTTVQSTTTSSAKAESGVQAKEPNSTEPFVIGNKPGDNDDELPFWAYIIIVVAVILIVVAAVIILYRRVDRWKSQGSYMVWDDELELSPAFTRESEFLLDNLAVNQEPGTPELQIYEIPLDSLGQQRVYIGTKRVAPKTDEHKERTQVAKLTKNKKHGKKERHDFQGNTLPRAGRRDHIYSSVNDEVNSALSEGDLYEGRYINGHNLPKVILSSQTLHEGEPSKPPINGSSSPDFVREIRSLTLGSRTKSVSNVFQNRPLPPAPSKRFSKSLDRLRFFETGPHNKGKGKTFPFNQKSTPIRAHPVLVKSSSFGGAFNKIVGASQPPVPAPRKGSIDLLDKSATFDVGHVRKSNLCHRHSKSLDTLLLLRDISWTAYDVDIYHSYASVHSNQSENNNEKEPSYASVTSDEKSTSHDETNGRLSSQSKASTVSNGPIDSDGSQDDFNEENPYASVSEDEISKAGSDPRYSNREDDSRDSGAPSSILESEDPTSPYASVRISQIPGLVIGSSLGEESNCNEEVFEKEDSGSSIGTCKDLREGEDLKRASTHTYLELFPDSGRDSIISETSSGYARPIDVLSNTSESSDNKDFDGESCKSLKNFESPSGKSSTFENSEECPSVEYCSEKEETVPLVFDNSTSPQDEETGSMGNTVKENPRLSQLSNEGLEEDEDDVKSDLEESSKSKEVHTYENTDFIQDLRNQDAREQLEARNSDATKVKTFGLQEARLTEEFYV